MIVGCSVKFMDSLNKNPDYTKWKEIYPDKFISEDRVFHNIHRGNRIFIGTP